MNSKVNTEQRIDKSYKLYIGGQWVEGTEGEKNS